VLRRAGPGHPGARRLNLIVACSFAVLALLWMGRLFKRRLQGFTGDCLGATQQVCEIAFYLGLAISYVSTGKP
jgi:adenosylcobinamide-GDP ribazoletransferase